MSARRPGTVLGAAAVVVILFVSVIALQYWDSEPTASVGTDASASTVTSDAIMSPESTTEPAAAVVSTAQSSIGRTTGPEPTTEPAAAVVSTAQSSIGRTTGPESTTEPPAAVVAAGQVTLVSRWDDTCLGPENGSAAIGARIVASACNGGATQLFSFAADGSIVQRDTCLDTEGGTGYEHDPIVIATCTGGASQKWRLDNERLIGINGMCIDLAGGGRAILFTCHEGLNQRWARRRP